MTCLCAALNSSTPLLHLQAGMEQAPAANGAANQEQVRAG
jgi:hypothetical protein